MITVGTTIPLAHERTHKRGKDERKITAAKVTRRPTLDDLIALEALSPANVTREVIERFTDLAPGIVRKLDLVDVRSLKGHLEPWFTDDEDWGSASVDEGLVTLGHSDNVGVDTIEIVRRPNLDDFIDLEGLTPRRQHKLMIQRLTNIPEGKAGRLDVQDVRAVMHVLGPFFEDGEGEARASSSDD